MSRLGCCLSLLLSGIAAICCGTDLSAQVPGERTKPMPPDKLRVEDDVLTIRAHSGGEVCSLAFSPDGKRLASGGGDETMKVWDVATGKQIFTKSQKGIFSSVAFSPDGKWLASANGVANEPIKIWDATTGAEVMSLEVIGHANSVAFSPDGKRLAAGGSIGEKKDGEEYRLVGGQVKIWEATTGKTVFAFDLGANFATGVAFSPDARWLAVSMGEAGGKQGEVVLWDAASGKQVRSFKAQRRLHSVAFSPDRKRLAVVSDDSVKLLDHTTGNEVLTRPLHSETGLEEHIKGVMNVAFSPSGKWLATASSDETVRLWDAATGREVLCLQHSGEKNGRYMYSVAFSPDGKRLAAGDRDGVIEVWKLAE